MRLRVAEWCDEFFKREAPPGILPHLMKRDKVGDTWLTESGYRWEHDRIRCINDKSFAMVFDMKKNDIVVNTFEIIFSHDGSWTEPHELAVMIFTGEVPR